MNPLLSRRALLGALGATAVLGPAATSGQTFASERVPVLGRDLWRWVAAQLVRSPGLAWFDTAAFGPTLRAVMVRAYRRLEEQTLDFAQFEAAYGPDSPGVRYTLSAAARFLGAEAGELALTHGSRAGLALVASGVDLNADDEIVASLADHPAAVYPWLVATRRRGARLTQVAVPDAAASTPAGLLQQYAAAMGPNTRVLLLSHVREADGAALPVRELCDLARSRGVLTVVDGTLAAGHLDFRIADLGCDVYVAAFDRWLNGPVDSGVLYVRRDAQAKVWPVWPDRADGWSGDDRYGQPAASTVDPDFVAQRRYGGGAQLRQGPAVAAIPLVFEFQDAVLRPRIHARIWELARQLRAGLERVAGLQVVTPAHASLHAGMVVVRAPGRDASLIAAAMAREDRIVVGHGAEGPWRDTLRVSLHAANDALDVDRCVAAIQRRI
jgi:isopenicillin-N epimerase